ncbi:hypothetical protein [Caballeronia udeis]|uniref:hypothetical protein n=1 Tax=Caballeronia udeis TaxID=1232866 RepID=UPI000B2F3C82|nr:hypothetical protein [Caballeronia udeis]
MTEKFNARHLTSITHGALVFPRIAEYRGDVRDCGGSRYGRISFGWIEAIQRQAIVGKHGASFASFGFCNAAFSAGMLLPNFRDKKQRASRSTLQFFQK